ncbi:MAG: GMC family oxidoreductase [Gammaproteobacteria bacterium]|nr:GMC family oxidoreductase [Gammaproteobacteria bacterium]
MLIDARTLVNGHTVEADICIVGAGAVGIAMALEFNGSNKKVAVMESGGLDLDSRTQSLYEGDHVGRPTYPLGRNRLRYFGGTTGHWAGHCRPFDQFDFSVRDWIPHSGWPIKIEELEPYLERSQPILGLGDYDYSSLEQYAKQLKLETLPLDSGRLISVMKQQSPPTRFGTAYRQALKESKNVSVYLYSNVLELITNESASHITRAEVACIDGPKYEVKAKNFVLATGGMENPRIMLLSNKSAPDGLGNSHGLVGRFYTDHILIRPALDISLSRKGFDFRLYSKIHRMNGGRMFGILTASDELTRREKLTRFRFHLYNITPSYDAPVGGVFSSIDGAREAQPLTKEGGTYMAVHMAMEPIPNPDTFVRLSAKRDLFGQRQLEVNWQVTDAERSNAHRAIELCALEFARMGFGRAYAPMLEKPDEWPANFTSGKHHCGTTRMSDSPKTGVVDRNCKVFDVDNLYVTGSSVFPTIGHTNPTINLVALSLRLADHLKGKMA